MPEASIQAQTSSSNQRDQQNEQRNQQSQQNQQGERFETQGNRDQAKGQLQDSIQTSEEAITQLVHGWAEAFRSFVPSAYLRPSEAIDFVYDLGQQVLSTQRRFFQELVGATQQTFNAVQNSAEVNTNGNGSSRKAEVQVRR